MQHALLSLLTAPEGGGALSLTVTNQADGEILDGTLTDGAGNEYPIEDGIPRLMPAELLAAQRSEMAARDAQVRDYDRMAFLAAFGCVEVPMTLRALGLGREDRLIEGGCGTGRMTQAFAHEARDVVAVDFSFESLRSNRRKLLKAGVKNVHLLQADLCHLPLQTAAFHRVASCQVIEHIPTDPARRQAVSELARVARPGSTLVVSAYQHSPITQVFGEKQGEHAGGIPFYRFARQELEDLLSSGLDVKSISGSLVYLWLAKCKKG
ncbi:MAG: methyltransferase domain-containing protein [Capsulimonadaceae bacterium]